MYDIEKLRLSVVVVFISVFVDAVDVDVGEASV